MAVEHFGKPGGINHRVARLCHHQSRLASVLRLGLCRGARWLTIRDTPSEVSYFNCFRASGSTTADARPLDEAQIASVTGLLLVLLHVTILTIGTYLVVIPAWLVTG